MSFSKAPSVPSTPQWRSMSAFAASGFLNRSTVDDTSRSNRKNLLAWLEWPIRIGACCVLLDGCHGERDEFPTAHLFPDFLKNRWFAFSINDRPGNEPTDGEQTCQQK